MFNGLGALVLLNIGTGKSLVLNGLRALIRRTLDLGTLIGGSLVIGTAGAFIRWTFLTLISGTFLTGRALIGWAFILWALVRGTLWAIRLTAGAVLSGGSSNSSSQSCDKFSVHILLTFVLF